MAKRVSRQAWKSSYTPIWKDRHLETAWLKEHWDYGGRIHEKTADALVEALKVPTSRAIGHALFFRLFAEYANALEVAGAWGWVLRTRRDHQLLLDAVLTYPDSAPRDFYKAARRNRSGSLLRLLDLPSEAKVVDALMHIAPPDWTRDECKKSLTVSVGQAKFLADAYFAQDEVIRVAFNRAKHGATMLHDRSLSEREFWVIAPHLGKRAVGGLPRYDMPKFTVGSEQIRNTRRGVTIAGDLIRYLAGLAKALNEAGLLYRAPPRSVRGE